MSQGAGRIESRIAELFAATRDRGLTVAELADAAFELDGATATREQRLSATRAGHRLIRRMKEADEKAARLFDEAHREAEAIVGPKPMYPKSPRTYAEAAWTRYKAAEEAYGAADKRYQAALEATEAYVKAKKLVAFNDRFGSWMRFIKIDRDTFRGEREFWRATADESGTLYFHPPDVPIRIWAVSIQPAGVIWAEAEIVRLSEEHVSVRYAGETARLGRERLWRSWALWRGVMFIASRSGRAANLLDAIWQDRYGRAAGGVPPVMQMALAEAMALLGVAADYSKEDVLAAFRREVKKAHPDLGGTAELFDRLVKARDRLLAALGTSAPPPKPPQYAPRGIRMVYRSVRSAGPARLGATRRLPTP
jgi:hypothetical protein